MQQEVEEQSEFDLTEKQGPYTIQQEVKEHHESELTESCLQTTDELQVSNLDQTGTLKFSCEQGYMTVTHSSGNHHLKMTQKVKEKGKFSVIHSPSFLRLEATECLNEEAEPEKHFKFHLRLLSAPNPTTATTSYSLEVRVKTKEPDVYQNEYCYYSDKKIQYDTQFSKTPPYQFIFNRVKSGFTFTNYDIIAAGEYFTIGGSSNPYDVIPSKQKPARLFYFESNPDKSSNTYGICTLMKTEVNNQYVTLYLEPDTTSNTIKATDTAKVYPFVGPKPTPT